MNNRIFSPSVRKRKAYSTALRVFLSYTWLKLKSKIFGAAYYQRKINQVHLRNAQRIKTRIQELQGLFIKFGQLISNLSNVLPIELRGPLEELQDHITSKPYSEIKTAINQELKADPEKIFTNFQQEPLAAASIGQVHLAEIDGKKVVVKIQHHNIDKIAEADLTILKNLVKLHAFFMNMKGLDHTYEQVEKMIREELDYTLEAQSMQRIEKNLASVPELKIKVPKVLPKYSTAKILCSEYCEGVKLTNLNTLSSWNIDQEDIAKRLIELYCKMILIDGFYHADPHPGNILINKEGEIILLDFGAVAELSESTKKAIPELIEAVVKNDTEKIVLALKNLGFTGNDKASRKYVKKLVNIFREFLENEVEFDGLNFQNIKLNSGLSSLASIFQKVDLREISNTIQIPKDYILLNRTIVLLIGNAFNLAPKLNTIDVVKPYIKKNILNNELGIAQLIINTVKSQVTTAIALPNELSQFLQESKELDLESELQGVNFRLQKIYFLLQQFFLGFMILGLFHFSDKIIPLFNGRGKIVFFIGVGLCAFLLLRSIYRSASSRPRA